MIDNDGRCFKSWYCYLDSFASHLWHHVMFAMLAHEWIYLSKIHVSSSTVKIRLNDNVTWVWPNMINMKVMDCDQKNEWDGLW